MSHTPYLLSSSAISTRAAIGERLISPFILFYDMVLSLHPKQLTFFLSHNIACRLIQVALTQLVSPMDDIYRSIHRFANWNESL